MTVIICCQRNKLTFSFQNILYQITRIQTWCWWLYLCGDNCRVNGRCCVIFRTDKQRISTGRRLTKKGKSFTLKKKKPGRTLPAEPSLSPEASLATLTTTYSGGKIVLKIYPSLLLQSLSNRQIITSAAIFRNL